MQPTKTENEKAKRYSYPVLNVLTRMTSVLSESAFLYLDHIGRETGFFQRVSFLYLRTGEYDGNIYINKILLTKLQMMF